MKEPQVVLYVDENGKEAITDPEPAEEANARAKDMAQRGIQVLSVVDPHYGDKRVNPVRDTRVWYREQGAQEGQDNLFSALMTYEQAAVTGEGLREVGYEIVGLISQEQFPERTGNAAEELFQGGDPLEQAMGHAQELVPCSDEAKATGIVPDHHAESRRYQALELEIGRAHV